LDALFGGVNVNAPPVLSTSPGAYFHYAKRGAPRSPLLALFASEEQLFVLIVGNFIFIRVNSVFRTRQFHLATGSSLYKNQHIIQNLLLIPEVLKKSTIIAK
jgi:hypothetical protein